MQINDKIVKILDLTDLEKSIFEYCDEARSIQNISSGTGYSRTGIKYSLESLVKKGFVQKIKYKKRYLFVSISKQELSRKIQDIADELLFSGGNLKGTRIRISKRDEFIIHVGAEEILPAYGRIASMNKNERIRAIQHHRSWLQLTDKITTEQLLEFNNNVIKNKIILDGMLNESAYKSYQQEIMKDPEKHRKNVESLKGRIADYTVFPDEYFNYDAEIWIFKNTALVIGWKEEVAIEITNKNITSFLKDMFDMTKKAGRKIDHNKMMEEIKV